MGVGSTTVTGRHRAQQWRHGALRAECTRKAPRRLGTLGDHWRSRQTGQHCPLSGRLQTDTAALDETAHDQSQPPDQKDHKPRVTMAHSHFRGGPLPTRGLHGSQAALRPSGAGRRWVCGRTTEPPRCQTTCVSRGRVRHPGGGCHADVAVLAVEHFQGVTASRS